jgi:hypothetical protein
MFFVSHMSRCRINAGWVTLWRAHGRETPGAGTTERRPVRPVGSGANMFKRLGIVTLAFLVLVTAATSLECMDHEIG